MYHTASSQPTTHPSRLSACPSGFTESTDSGTSGVVADSRRLGPPHGWSATMSVCRDVPRCVHRMRSFHATIHSSRLYIRLSSFTESSVTFVIAAEHTHDMVIAMLVQGRGNLFQWQTCLHTNHMTYALYVCMYEVYVCVCVCVCVCLCVTYTRIAVCMYVCMAQVTRDHLRITRPLFPRDHTNKQKWCDSDNSTIRV